MQSIHQRVMDLYRNGQNQTIVLVRVLSEDDTRDRVTAPLLRRAGEAGKAEPRQIIDGDRVARAWFEPPISVALID